MVPKAEFKKALRVLFLTHFTKKFCRFLTPKVKSSTDMINPLIESSDFLFLRIKKNLIWIFENFVKNRQSTFHEFKFSISKCEIEFVCFRQNFQKFNSKCFFCAKNRKSELSIDGLIIYVLLLTFGVRKRQKFFVK
jgi:hypothetical protein